MVALKSILSRHYRWWALALGALAACGFQPLALWPLTLLALAGLICQIAKAENWKQAALIGWIFGIGHFALGNNWIATAFTYQENMPTWLGWAAVGGISLFLAIYPALAALAAWSVSRENYAALIVNFAAFWIVSEWLRSWVFSGYAWNPLAMAALGPFTRPGLAALLPWLGTYAMSGLVVLLSGAWLIALQRRKADWRGAMLMGLPVALMLMPTLAPVQQGTLPFTLIQPNIAQMDLNDPDHFDAQFRKTVHLSRPTGQSRRLVLWPESGMPYFLATGYPRYFYAASDYEADPLIVRRLIGEAIGRNNLVLTGAVNLELRDGEPMGARNVVTAVDGAGAIRGNYSKAHLVPGGEYLPLRPLLEPLGLSRLVPGSMDFRPGPGPQTLELGNWGKAGVQICYEIVFSGQVIDRKNRPDYLFNPSNDGWFGTWGPPQHLAQARMRAIEEGVPVLRSTTTGISAVIDADGVVRQTIATNVAGRLDGLVPPAHQPTWFAQIGNTLPLSWALLLLIATQVAKRRRRS